MRWLGLLGAVALLGLVLVPFVAPDAGQWGGTDGDGMTAITDSNPSYEPWFDSVWTPPSAEVETALFTLQGALGGAIIGYYVGSSSDE